jgi:hypothetical protein
MRGMTLTTGRGECRVGRKKEGKNKGKEKGKK